MPQQLTPEEFSETFVAPMRRLDVGESHRPVAIGSYVEDCISKHSLPTSRSEIDVHHVYVSGDGRFTHILLHFGQPDTYLTIVTVHPEDQILGHRIMNLRKEYGLAS